MEGKDFKALNPHWIFPIQKWIQNEIPLPSDLPLAPFLREKVQWDSKVPFGTEAKKQLFILDDSWAFLNHGSYGGALTVTLEAQSYYRQLMENQPVKFMGSYVLPLLVHATRELASFVGAKPDELVFVPSATAAINAVTRSLDASPFRLASPDIIIAFDIGYNAIQSTLGYVCTQSGARFARFEVPYPWNEEQLCKNLQDTLQKYGSSIRLAVFDHITSMPAFLFPIKRLIQIVRSFNPKILILIDGAHAVGNIELNLHDLGADFYTSNCHKWLCTPKGCAFLWARKEYQHLVRPNVISQGYNVGFLEEFYWSATSDYTAYLTVPVAIKAFRDIGVQKIMDYNKKLAWEGANLLARSWGTKIISTLETSTTMADIEIPKGVYGTTQFNELHDVLEEKYKIEVPISAFRGLLYLRISAQIHNNINDYKKLATAILEIQTGKVRSKL